MVGCVASVEGGGKDQNDIWVAGIEESSTLKFEIMLDRNR